MFAYLLCAFAELFTAAYREGSFSERGRTVGDGALASKREDAREDEALHSNASPANVSAQQPDAVYASAAAAAANVSANALVLAICRYRGDPGTGLWLELLMKGDVAGPSGPLEVPIAYRDAFSACITYWKDAMKDKAGSHRTIRQAIATASCGWAACSC